MIARFGGKEFVIYAALTDKATAEELSQRLVRTESATTYVIPGSIDKLSVTISVGGASVLSPLNVTDVNSRKGAFSGAFRMADSNLYKAKQFGKASR